MTDFSSPQQEGQPPRWEPLSAVDRRVAGVLVEKAKTTPNAYPMSLNAICAACNQKSNRWPAMSLEPEDVEESLGRLRQLGALGVIEGYGRVAKYRHYLYDWLGVDKAELAVMAELLLRGPQTEGELRGRTARMEPVRDLAALRPLLASLKRKGLVIPLTPEGRGHTVAHALYPPNEFDKIRAQHATAGATAAAAAHEAVAPPVPGGEPAPPISTATPVPAAAPPVMEAGPAVAGGLQREIDDLKSQVAQLRSDLEDLTALVQKTEDDVRNLREDLGA